MNTCHVLPRIESIAVVPNNVLEPIDKGPSWYGLRFSDRGCHGPSLSRAEFAMYVCML